MLGQKCLRVPEAATYVGLSVSTLNKMRCRGDGPVFVKLGRAVVYRIDELDRWLASRSVRSTSEYRHGSAL